MERSGRNRWRSVSSRAENGKRRVKMIDAAGELAPQPRVHRSIIDSVIVAAERLSRPARHSRRSPSATYDNGSMVASQRINGFESHENDGASHLSTGAPAVAFCGG